MINHVSLQGRFTKDPELSYSSDLPYVRFTLAWSEKIKGGKENVCFINCVAFNAFAEFISKYFKKGDMAIAEGKIITKTYEDKLGNKKYNMDLKVDKLHFCGVNKKQNDEDEVLPSD